jgi:hypothetical protein
VDIALHACFERVLNPGTRLQCVGVGTQLGDAVATVTCSQFYSALSFQNLGTHYIREGRGFKYGEVRKS